MAGMNRFTQGWYFNATDRKLHWYRRSGRLARSTCGLVDEPIRLYDGHGTERCQDCLMRRKK